MKKVFKILTLIMLILTILKITDTYAKYFTQATGSIEPDIGQWKIMLNDNIDLYSETGDPVVFELDVTDLVASENVEIGKIAPGSAWEAKIVLDPTGTDVAIKYDIEVDPAEFEVIDTDYEITLENVDKELVRTGENKYTGIVTLADAQAGEKHNIKCSIVWNNDENNNTQDTETGSMPNQELKMPLKLTCVQYLGETITEYTE